MANRGLSNINEVQEIRGAQVPSWLCKVAGRFLGIPAGALYWNRTILQVRDAEQPRTVSPQRATASSYSSRGIAEVRESNWASKIGEKIRGRCTATGSKHVRHQYTEIPPEIPY